MSPAHRTHLAALLWLLSGGTAALLLYCYPLLLYLCLLLLLLCGLLLLLGPSGALSARPGGHLHAVLRRWARAWGTAPRLDQGRNSGKGKLSSRGAEQSYGLLTHRVRLVGRGPYRVDPLGTEIFSPRDVLMGSYLSRADSPPQGNPLRGRNPRQQLRDGLAQPNYAVYTPNRRLSFAGEPVGTGARFTITPQRHYPLQQQGASPVGVLPPFRWDGFRQKSVLSPRSGVCSPVTVKVGRPDAAAHSLESPVFTQAPVDPCSRESVLKVLRENRKREVDVDEVEEESSFSGQHRSKRRRNDSGGSAQSAFEPLLPNGTSPQLIPKPGTLKRGLALASEEQSLKRSRTSSVSSSSGAPSSRRNPISSSYSSSKGIGQRKRPITASPLSSPGLSRAHTPECSSKKTREEKPESPSPEPCVQLDRGPGVPPEREMSSALPADSGVSSREGAGSGGKRRRKIQLMTREESLNLPPAPELGYTITVKDLDDEKRSALDKIHKLLEPPVAEPASSSGTVSAVSVGLSTASTPSLSVGAVTSMGGSPAPTATNILLESLKRKSPAPAPVTAASLGSGVTSPAAPSSSAVSESSSALPSGFKPIFLPSTPSTTATEEPKLAHSFKPIFSSVSTTGSTFGSSAAGTAPQSSSQTGQSSLQAAPVQSNKTDAMLGGFGTSTTTAAATQMFGTSTTAPSATQMFGTSTTAPSATQMFGTSTTAPSATQMFGTSTTAPSATQMFGTSTTTTTATATPMFGTSTTAPSATQMFGTSTTAPSATQMFGTSTTAPSATQMFGSSTTADAAQMFGTGTSTTAAAAQMFGTGTSTTAAATQMFGTGTSTTAAATQMFGAGTSTTAAATQMFGSSITTPSVTQMFGSSVTTPSATQMFGSSTTASAPQTFGTSTKPSASLTFGTTTTASAPQTFGTTTASATQMFGSSTTASAPQMFGTSATASAPQMFGTSATASAPQMFGTSTTASAPLTFGATAAPVASLTFGTTTTASAPKMFGSSTKASAAQMFGATTASAPLSFGTTPTAAATQMFGATTTLPPPPPYGTNTSTQAPPTFGSTSSTQAPPTFGSTSSQSFTFGKSALESSSLPSSFGSSAEVPKAFAFGAAPSALEQTVRGTAAPSAAPSFGTKPSFSFGSSTAAAPQSSGTFTFGSSTQPAPPSNTQPPPQFKFGAAAPAQFGTPANNTGPQMGFSFGATNSDKPAFGPRPLCSGPLLLLPFPLEVLGVSARASMPLLHLDLQSRPPSPSALAPNLQPHDRGSRPDVHTPARSRSPAVRPRTLPDQPQTLLEPQSAAGLDHALWKDHPNLNYT